jgi:hypothetical protein
MRHTLPWIATGLLVLGGGCQHARLDLDERTEAATGFTLPDELPGGITPASYRVRPAIPASAIVTNLPPAPALPPPATPLPPLRTESVPILASVGPVQWQYSAPSHEGARLERPAGAVSAPTRAARPPSWGHADDYRWLLGSLQYDEMRRCWMVEYGGPSQSDAYGGHLELVNPGTMTGFRCGQIVRVEGDLVDPAPHEIRPAYRVRRLQVIRR